MGDYLWWEPMAFIGGDGHRSSIRHTPTVNLSIPPESYARAISGHLDPSMLRRYNIVGENSVKEAARRMRTCLEEKRKAAQSAADLQYICNDDRHSGEEPGSDDGGNVN
jgi:hypothetical protein